MISFYIKLVGVKGSNSFNRGTRRLTAVDCCIDRSSLGRRGYIYISFGHSV